MEVPSRHAGTNDVFQQYVAAPASRSTRDAWCRKIARRSITENFSTEDSMEKSSMAEQQLLAKQLDCKFLGAFHAELRYAAVNHVLAVGAWQACLRLVPVGHMTTAPELAIYLQCLRMVNGTSACAVWKNDTRPYSASGIGAACAKVLASNEWSQSGEQEWSGTPRSLFHRDEAHAARSPSSGKMVLHLPTPITLQGTIHTGFYLNCCTFGMGYVMPYAYLHLARAVMMTDRSFGITPVQDIQLDRSATGSEVDEPATVSCERVASGITAHYALSVYCWGTQIHLLSPARQSDPRR